MAERFGVLDIEVLFDRLETAVDGCLKGTDDIQTTIDTLSNTIIQQAWIAHSKISALLGELGVQAVQDMDRDFYQQLHQRACSTLQDVVFTRFWKTVCTIPVGNPAEYRPLLFIKALLAQQSVIQLPHLWVGNGRAATVIDRLWDIVPRYPDATIFESTLDFMLRSRFEHQIENKGPERMAEWVNLCKLAAILTGQGIMLIRQICSTGQEFVGNRPPYSYRHDRAEPWLLGGAQFFIFAADAKWEGINRRELGNLNWWKAWKRRLLMVAAGHGVFPLSTRQVALEAYDALLAAETKDYKTLGFAEKFGWKEGEDDEEIDSSSDNEDKKTEDEST